MIKRMLLVVLGSTAMLLSGCLSQQSPTSRKPGGHFLTTDQTTITSSELVSTSDTSTTSNSSSIIETSTSTSLSSSSAPTTSQEIVSDSLIYLCGEYLPFSNYGIHIGNEASGYQNRDALINAMNTQAGFDLVSSASAENCTILTDDGTSNQEHLHLAVGTSSKNGSIQFNLSIAYTKVIVVASAYYKSTYTVDTEALIEINGVAYNFETIDASPHPEQETFEVILSEPSTTLKFSNKDEKQRFYLDSIHLYF